MPGNDHPSLLMAARKLASARRVAVVTGAGVSAESGIPTFRDKSAMPGSMQALWKDFDPLTLATPEAFASDPQRVSRWYDWRRLGCLAAQPNPGHLALARLERELAARAGRLTLITQNVDRLHQKAGSANVVELHGNILAWRCTSTGREVTPPPEPMTQFPPVSPFRQGAQLRPCVVWFGEMLPPDAISAADEAAASCDVFMSVGTSAVVYPAAGLLHVARAAGAFTVEVNKDATPATGVVDVALQGPSGEILPSLLRLAFGHAPP